MTNAHADSKRPTESARDALPGLPTGISRFMFSGWDGPELRVWTYVPTSVGANAPILFVMHGVERDAKRYLEDWVRVAERHGAILVAPEFDERRFPGPELYNQGGVIDPESGKKRPRDIWTFSVIEPLFEDVRRRSESHATTYSIYGHSAGAQFVHRYVMMAEPAHLGKAVAANAGWYTGFEPGRAYPQGLKLGRRETVSGSKGFARRLTILLGTADTESDDRNLRTDAWARGQGKNRLERGRAFFAQAQAVANIGDETFAWELRYAPGIGHENRKMTAYAADILFRRSDARRSPEVLLSIRRHEAAEECVETDESPSQIRGLAKTACVFLSDYEIGVWANGAGVLRQSGASVTLDQPLGGAAGAEFSPVKGHAFNIALIDAGGKDPRESSVLEHKLDALVERGTDLVLLINSPTDGRVRKAGPVTFVHIPRDKISRMGLDTDNAADARRIVISLAPEPSRRKIRLAIYPAINAEAQNQTEQSRPDPGQWKPFSELVRRIVSRTRDKIKFEAGQDDQGDYIAFYIDWSPNP
ncbi:hypothetical protein [Hyphomonas sp.]|uniref:hypothetical protein n=1 Tax=Hyphomonas sp. TaxID=87 RepID=UPI00391C34D2